MSLNIYVASSWRNEVQPDIVKLLRGEGHEVYDFREPNPGAPGFSWREVMPGAETLPPVSYDPRAIRAKGSDWVTAEEYLQMIAHPRAHEGFRNDKLAMVEADLMVMVLPCGKSAHLEIGWAMGKGIYTAILLEDPVEPELMYKFADLITPSVDELVTWVNSKDDEND